MTLSTLAVAVGHRKAALLDSMLAEWMLEHAESVPQVIEQDGEWWIESASDARTIRAFRRPPRAALERAARLFQTESRFPANNAKLVLRYAEFGFTLDIEPRWS
jgi:hypothetical protein